MRRCRAARSTRARVCASDRQEAAPRPQWRGLPPPAPCAALRIVYIAGQGKETLYAATDRPRRHVPLSRNGCHAHARGQSLHLRPVDGGRRPRDVQADHPLLRGAPAQGEDVPAPAGERASWPGPALLDRGPGVRPGIPPAPHRLAEAGRLAPAVHPDRAAARPPAGSEPPPVGGVGDRRTGQRRRHPAGQFRPGDKDPPLGHRRHLRRRDRRGHPQPDPPRSAGAAAAALEATPIKVGKLVRHVAPTLPKLASGLVRRDISLPRSVPRTRFNANVSAHRVFDARTFALDEIRGIKGFVEGATVNDVIVSVCGGALRKYLEAKDELPDESLIAMAPMSVRSDRQRGADGNQVSAMRLPVGSDIEDPLDRLRAVHAASDEAKRFTRTAGPELSMELAEFLPTTTSGLAARAYGRWHMAERLPPVFNTVITNVPISNHPLYSMGTKMVAYYGLGPVVHGVGLFQPVIGYDGKITVSAISCREMMPDPAFYCECLQASFDELKAATIGTRGRAVVSTARGTLPQPGNKKRASKEATGKSPARKKPAAKKAARKTNKRKNKAPPPQDPQAD